MNSKKYLVDGWWLEELQTMFVNRGLDKCYEYVEDVLSGECAEELLESQKMLDFLESNATLRAESVGEESHLTDYWWEVAYLPEITCLEGEEVEFRDYVREVMENLSEVEESSAIH